MEVQKIQKTWQMTLKEYAVITVSIMIMVVGIYFFKFPNNFSFGGVTGFASVVNAMTNWSATQFTNVVNIGLLVLGFIFLGRDFGFKTGYATLVMSAGSCRGSDGAAVSPLGAIDHRASAGAGICHLSAGGGIGGAVQYRRFQRRNGHYRHDI